MVLDQLRGFAGNLRDSLTGATWEGFLPPSIVSTIKFVVNAVPNALGFGERYEMLRDSIVLSIVAILSSVITLGATLVFVGLFAVTAGIAILRHVPIVDANWPLPDVEVFD